MKIHEVRSTLRGRRWLPVLLCVPLIAAASGCVSDDDTSAKSESASADEPANIALFIVDAANTHQSAYAQAAQDTAKQLGAAKVRVFGAKFDANLQVNQIQDAIATGQYNAMLVAPVDGTVVVPAIERAIEQGIKVVCTFSVCGPDQATFSNQIPGLVAQVSGDYEANGGVLADATVAACQGKDPCKVVYLEGIGASLAAEASLTKGFKAGVAQEPSIDIVAEAQGKFLADASYKATKDILQTQKDFDVIASLGDNQMVGIAQAIREAGLIGKLKLVGNGASVEAVKGIESGAWFASPIVRPENQGHLAAEYVIKAVRGEKVPTLTDSDKSDVANGYITKENVSAWKPEWAG